jgi:hypothetical protein
MNAQTKIREFLAGTDSEYTAADVAKETGLAVKLKKTVTMNLKKRYAI